MRLHTPALVSLMADLPAESPWARLWRGGKDARDDRTFMKFTGMRSDDFDDLLKEFTPLHAAMLREEKAAKVAAVKRGPTRAREPPQSDPRFCAPHIAPPPTKKKKLAGARGRGRPPTMSASDCLGLALRFTRTSCRQQLLADEFGVSKSVLARMLWPSIELLFRTLKTIPDAELRYPSLAEAEAMEAGMTIQWGPCPMRRGSTSRLAVLAGDGTTWRIGNAADEETQRLFAYRKGGHRINTVFLWDAWGRIVYAVTNGLGTSNDYKLSNVEGGMLERHLDPAINPDKLACFWDAGFQPAINDGSNGLPASFRPLKQKEKTGIADPRLRAQAIAFSGWCTMRRQMAEWGNNMLQRGFIRLMVPMQLAQRDEYDLLMQTCIHLHNFRTRRIGYNQIQTTFRRHVDEEFRDALLEAKRVGGVDGLHTYLANPGLKGSKQVLGVDLPLGLDLPLGWEEEPSVAT